MCCFHKWRVVLVSSARSRCRAQPIKVMHCAGNAELVHTVGWNVSKLVFSLFEWSVVDVTALS